MIPLYPLKLPASLRHRLWGTRDLTPLFPTQAQQIGEAWFSFEENAVENGPFAGTTLGELVERLGPRLMGSSYRPSGMRRRMAGEVEKQSEQQAQVYFPVLSKLLFASQHLSVQVHPNDAYAMAREDGPGKTEMWYIVDAKPGAELVLGLTQEMSEADLCRAASNGEIEKYLRWVPVEKGQTLFISPGTLHTIGAGLVICEIQQNSDLTYRFYDFGRLDPEGKPRPLHIEKAASVTRQDPHPGALPPFRFPASSTDAGCEREFLCACKYFGVERLTWEPGEATYTPDPARFHLLIFLEGRGRLVHESWNDANFESATAYLVPAECPSFKVEADTPTVAIRSYVPDLQALRAELTRNGADQQQIDALIVSV